MTAAWFTNAFSRHVLRSVRPDDAPASPRVAFIVSAPQDIKGVAIVAMGREFILRAVGIGFLALVLLVPVAMIRDLVSERQMRRNEAIADIAFGWGLARQMGGLDVGQSVMVKDRAVLAVEAIEGTDKAILRAGELCGYSPFVVVKVAKPNQDMRFDVPTVGVQTIESMKAAGARCLAIEAGKTIFLDERETIARADRYGITIVARAGD